MWGKWCYYKYRVHLLVYTHDLVLFNIHSRIFYLCCDTECVVTLSNLHACNYYSVPNPYTCTKNLKQMIPITSLLDEPISKTLKDWSTGLEQRDMKQDLSWFCLVSHFPDTLLGSDIVSVIKEKEISINYMVID